MYSLLGGSLQTGGGRSSSGRRSARRSARRSGRRSARKSARKSSARKSARRSSRRSARRSTRRSPKTVGSRASVARSKLSKKTPGGLSLGNGLFRGKDGRIKSVAVSRQAKAKYNKNPALQARAKLVKAGFAAVRAAKRPGQKVNAQAVLKNPADASRNPKRYLK